MTFQLRAENLQKSYKSYRVVKDLSLTLNNEIVGLLGPNGAGKTKSFNMLAGLEFPNHGEIYLNHQKITRYPLYQRARIGIGYLPQESSIFKKLSVMDNILAVLEFQKKFKRKERKKRCADLLEEFRIDHLSKIQGDKLSGGEKRRVEIARALALEPQFMLLDEPFAGIDPISISDIKQIIIHLYKRGIGILITDHNVRETLAICQRAYIMNAGSILAEGTPAEILSNETVKDFYLGHQFDDFIRKEHATIN